MKAQAGLIVSMKQDENTTDPSTKEKEPVTKIFNKFAGNEATTPAAYMMSLIITDEVSYVQE